jgi:ketosteroid isomerase-like protein
MQRHIVHGQVGEQTMRAPVCISFAFRAGKIAAINEYVDSAAVSVMMP